MATKTTFTVDGTMISNAFSTLFAYISEARFRVYNKEGKSVATMPLYLALLLGIFLPILTVTVLIVVLVMSYKIAVEKENATNQRQLEK